MNAPTNVTSGTTPALPRTIVVLPGGAHIDADHARAGNGRLCAKARQDLLAMSDVQAGMTLRGVPGPRPSPARKRPVINFQRNLTDDTGSGAPLPIG